jgi:hypothetical protein
MITVIRGPFSFNSSSDPTNVEAGVNAMIFEIFSPKNWHFRLKICKAIPAEKKLS